MPQTMGMNTAHTVVSDIMANLTITELPQILQMQTCSEFSHKLKFENRCDNV